MIKTQFQKEKGYLDTTCLDDVKSQDFVDYIDATRLNVNYPRTLKILTDATQCRFLFKESDLAKIVSANNLSLQVYDQIIDAMIIDGPVETALSMLFSELSVAPNYKFKVFSSRVAALSWLAAQ